jgi:uncharacterized protein (DUF1501 family)
MLNRRAFLVRSLRGTSLLAVGSVVPQFLVNTARAAEAGNDRVLVVLEMTGGNDGLNTVIPYADDLYQKARPTLRQTKEQVVRVDDHIGLNGSMRAFEKLLQNQQLAIVQGVGYPNPNRSHFESMDIWQCGDPTSKQATGWIARSVPDLFDKKGNVPVMQVGPQRLPLALSGAASGVVSIDGMNPFRLELGGGSAAERKDQRKLLDDLTQQKRESGGDLLQFVQRRQTQTFYALDRLQEVLRAERAAVGLNSLNQKLQLVARLIEKELGTRVFYVSIDGFDTHANQANNHASLLADIATSVNDFFTRLKDHGGHDKRVALMTFSEFGRRVHENGSKGTDHGSGSCLFVAGPGVKGGLVGKHPSLKDLDDGDLRYHTDFRSLYATLLDDWLGCRSETVLGTKLAKLDLIRKT